jgi:hypothetical protein
MLRTELDSNEAEAQGERGEKEREEREGGEKRGGRESGRQGPVLITTRLKHGKNPSSGTEFVEDTGIHKFDSDVGELGAVRNLLVSH